MILLLKTEPTVSKWPKLVVALVHSTKVASKSGLKSLNTEKETFRKRKMRTISGSNLPLWEENRSIVVARTLGLVNRFFTTTTTVYIAPPDWLKTKL